FPFAQRSRASGMLAIRQERAIVGGVDYKRSLAQRVLFERGKYLPNRPIELLNHVAVESSLARPSEPLGRENRHLRHDVRQIQEEWLGFVRLDESYRALGEPPGEL